MSAAPQSTAPRSAPLLVLMARLEWPLLLTALLLVVLVYPFQLRPELMQRLNRWWQLHPTGWPALTRSQLEPLLAFFYSPLILKGALAGYALLAFSALRLARTCLAGRPASDDVAPVESSRWLPVALFFAWMMLSAAWSPTPAVSRDGAWWVGVYGLSFWLMLRRGISALELRQLAYTLIGLGLAAMFYLAAMRSPWLLGRWFNNPFTDVRNLMGSVLGHNSAAGSFLMLTAFPALALALAPGPRLRRLGCLAYLASAWMVILITQSRAVWVLAPLLLALALVQAGGTLGRRALRYAPTVILLLLAVGLLLQLVNHPLNPFYVREKPFIQRIRDLSTKGLLAESRLRLNVIGLQLVPEAPLIGHGLYAFQYVYPAVQGRYFNAHPDSNLMRTLYRSHMAHNEYLQVLIEQGAIGLGLMAWMYGALARAGWRRRRGLEAGERLLHQACGWSALGMALHALVDFPFHIPQLGLPALFCAAAFAARRAAADPLPVQFHPALAASSGAGGFRPFVFARLLGAALCLGAMPFASLPFSIALLSDVKANRGISFLESIYAFQRQMTATQRGETLKNAITELDGAVQLQPSNGMAALRLSEALTVFGSLQAHRSFDERYATAMREQDRLQALATFKLARRALEQAGQGLDYHLVPFRAFQLAREQARIDPSPALFDEQLRALEQTLALLPHYNDALQNYIDLLASDPAVPRERLMEARLRFYRNDWKTFERTYAQPAYRQIAEGHFAEGAQQLEDLLPVEPGKPSWSVLAAQARLMLGQRSRAQALLRAAWEKDPAGVRAVGGGVLLAALDGQWMSLLIEQAYLPAYYISDAAWFRAVELEAQRRTERLGYPTWYPRPNDVPPVDWDRLLAEARPQALWSVYGDAAAARQAFEARLALGGPAPEPRFWQAAAQVAKVLKDEALAARAEQALKSATPPAARPGGAIQMTPQPGSG